MSTHVLTNASLWLHDIALHDLANTLQFTTTRETLDNTRFGAQARNMKVGLYTVTVTASGFADMTRYDADLFDAYSNATLSPVSVSATSADGDVAYTCRGLVTSLSPLGGQIGELSALSVEAAGRSGVRPVRGTILHPETARTASGSGTGRQLGAVSADQTVFAALHVLEASGTSPTLDVVVESDNTSTFASATTRLTFTQATGPTGEWQSAAGPVTDDWWRVSYTIGGTNPSFTFVVVVGIAATSLS